MAIKQKTETAIDVLCTIVILISAIITLIPLQWQLAIWEFAKANWNGIFLTIFNGLLALFTFFLWRSTDKLWLAARKQSEDMRESFLISKESADATKKIVSTMETNAKRQMRAYVSVLGGGEVPQDINTGWRYEIRMVIKNTGFTPAHAVNFETRAAIMDSDLPDDFDFSVPVRRDEGKGHIPYGGQHFYQSMAS